jgi:hypothetical protein
MLSRTEKAKAPRRSIWSFDWPEHFSVETTTLTASRRPSAALARKRCHAAITGGVLTSIRFMTSPTVCGGRFVLVDGRPIVSRNSNIRLHVYALPIGYCKHTHPTKPIRGRRSMAKCFGTRACPPTCEVRPLFHARRRIRVVG